VKSRTDKENTEPNLAMPSTAKEDPIRKKLLRAREEPRLTNSKTDSDEPIRVQPNRANLDPKRAQDLKAS
jgi:hypothetical protein